jgi:hypothetical protein
MSARSSFRRSFSAQYNLIALAITLASASRWGGLRRATRAPGATSFDQPFPAARDPAVIRCSSCCLFRSETGRLTGERLAARLPADLPGLGQNWLHRRCQPGGDHPDNRAPMGGVAGWARFTRAFTLDVLKEDYVRTARSRVSASTRS